MNSKRPQMMSLISKKNENLFVRYESVRVRNYHKIKIELKQKRYRNIKKKIKCMQLIVFR